MYLKTRSKVAVSDIIDALPELPNILDTITPSESASLLATDIDSMELYLTCIHLMEEFIDSHPFIITEPNFAELFDESVEELISETLTHHEFFIDENTEEEIDDIIQWAKDDFFKNYIPPRSFPDTFVQQEKIDKQKIDAQFNYLYSQPQHEQRTDEWYEFRYKLITASNAHKIFGSQATLNQIIFEKCQPLKKGNGINYDDCESIGSVESVDSMTDNNVDPNVKTIVFQSNINNAQVSKPVNINSPLHWGNKYEPVSLMIYMAMFKTTVAEFGCIQHPKYPFLGASPDGIIDDPSNPRYGRMLEIKNIVNRVINGIPKKEYWIQMQLQMEVCGLDECDFLETKFIEYNNAETFYADEIDNMKKGVIIYFVDSNNQPIYEYKPLNVPNTFEVVNSWGEKVIQQSTNMFVSFIYWKLETLSCVLVLRNKHWFEHAVGDISKTWDIIKKERVSGAEHRAPKKRAPAPAAKPNGDIVSLFKKQMTEEQRSAEYAPMDCLVIPPDNVTKK